MVEYGTYTEKPKRKYKNDERLAGFGVRLGAYLIDGLITGFIGGIIGVGVALVTAPGMANMPAAQYESALLRLQFVSMVLGLLANLAYFGYLPVRWDGRTVGKNLLGIRIVSNNEHPLTFWRMVLRNTIGYAVSGIFFYIGFLWVLWDKDKQSWHDKISQTVVVHD